MKKVEAHQIKEWHVNFTNKLTALHSSNSILRTHNLKWIVWFSVEPWTLEFKLINLHKTLNIENDFTASNKLLFRQFYKLNILYSFIKAQLTQKSRKFVVKIKIIWILIAVFSHIQLQNFKKIDFQSVFSPSLLD